ncbi:MAG: dipeptidase [Spirochaetales bacterium]|nr:dipeptidase [Spirochaetales bacterium]
MNYKYIDMHCDTLLKEFKNKKLYDNPENMLDISRMVKAGQAAQFFAIFFPPQNINGQTLPEEFPVFPSDEQLFEQARTLLFETAEKYPEHFGIAFTSDDIKKNINMGRCSAILTIEDGRMINGDISMLPFFYDAGVRVIGLTWNYSNYIGFPNSPDPDKMSLGLTDFGKEAVYEMNKLGIIVDVSHLSDGGFLDVAEVSSKPFIASHSNCRALCNHPRNLTDKMIKTLATHGGITGLNFCPMFLSNDGKNNSRVEDLCRHIIHLINTGGEDCVALGTDFDGISGEFEIGQPTEMKKLFMTLEQKGLSERQLEKLAYGNVLRVLEESL